MAKPLSIHNAQQVAWGRVFHGAAEALHPRQRENPAAESRSSLEQHFEPTFATRLALREKQIQQNYRPYQAFARGAGRDEDGPYMALALVHADSGRRAPQPG